MRGFDSLHGTLLSKTNINKQTTQKRQQYGLQSLTAVQPIPFRALDSAEHETLPLNPFPIGRRVSYGEISYPNDANVGDGSLSNGGGGAGVYQPQLDYNTTVKPRASSRSAHAQQQQQQQHSIGLSAQSKAIPVTPDPWYDDSF